MRQRPHGSSPGFKAGTDIGSGSGYDTMNQRRGSVERRRVGGGGIVISGSSSSIDPILNQDNSWVITTASDHVSVSIETTGDVSHSSTRNVQGLDHRQPYYQYPPIQSSPSSVHSTTLQRDPPQRYNMSMPYQNTRITEESVRQLNIGRPPVSLHGVDDIDGLSPYDSRSSTSSTLLTAWKLDQTATTCLQDYHTVFRTPLHVPDNAYGAYLMGRSRRKGMSTFTKSCCASFCAGYSAVAVCFLLFVGIVLDTQPLYIPGTLPELVVQSTVTYRASDGEVLSYSKPVVQYLVPGPADERLPIVKTAYRTAFAYFCTFLISLYVWDPARIQFVTRWIRQRQALLRLPFGWGGATTRSSSSFLSRGNGMYHDIPDYENGGLLPTTTHPNDLLFAASHYQPGLWGRATGSIQRWMAVRGWTVRPRRRNKTKKKG